jgi:[ribosomal protein S5]-alanine N-acetyltransferase
MKLETKKLILRQTSSNDAYEIAKMGDDKDVSYFTYYWPYPLTVDKTKKIIAEIEKERKQKKTVILFKIQLRETNETIGVLDVYDINKTDKNAKIGYWLGRNYWGKGYALEAVDRTLN